MTYRFIILPFVVRPFISYQPAKFTNWPLSVAHMLHEFNPEHFLRRIQRSPLMILKIRRVVPVEVVDIVYQLLWGIKHLGMNIRIWWCHRFHIIHMRTEYNWHLPSGECISPHFFTHIVIAMESVFKSQIKFQLVDGKLSGGHFADLGFSKILPSSLSKARSFCM